MDNLRFELKCLKHQEVREDPETGDPVAIDKGCHHHWWVKRSAISDEHFKGNCTQCNNHKIGIVGKRRLKR